MLKKILAFCVLLVGLMATSVPTLASNILELGKSTRDNSIVTLGTAPPKKITQLDLGGLRTREAQLPAAPLTRSQRMTVRAKLAIRRQEAVRNAVRERKVIRRKREGDAEGEEPEIAINEFGEPYME